VYAAIAMDPYHLDDFVRNNHWDYARLDEDSTTATDPEAAMTNLVEQMADGNHFDYDVTTYTAEAPYASTTQAYIVPGSSYGYGYGYGCFYGSWDPWCDGYYPSPSFFSLSIGFGGFFGHHRYGYGFGSPYGFGYPYGYGYGYGYGYPIYGGRYGRGYGATGYGYSLGHGWSYNHRPIVLGAGGAYTGGAGTWGLGNTVGYRTRGALVNQRANISPLYGVSRFNTQRGPSRGVESPNRFGGRRDMSVGQQTGFRTRIENTGPSDMTGMRPGPRNDGVGQSRVNGGSAPTRVQPQGDSRPTRVEPQQQPRSEPRSEPRARAPERSGGGGGGGGGGRRGGGGGGGGRGGGGGHGGGGGGRRP
jgi:hypothetical protein